MTLAKRLKAWRKEHHLRQTEAAWVMGAPYATYTKWERGERQPTEIVVRHIERVMATWRVTEDDDRRSD